MMKERVQILAGMRQHYALIYTWHTRHGLQRWDARDRWPGHDEWRTRYEQLVKVLQPPEDATAEHIAMVAREVISGQMEWAYGEQTDQGVPLDRVARAILEMSEELKQAEQEDRAHEAVSSFRNVPSEEEPLVPQKIEFPTQPDQDWSVEEYYRLAKRVYRDVPDQGHNIGGRIFLTETNMEVSHAAKDTYVFHNAKALHLEGVREPSALVNLAIEGAVVVEEVTIGG